MERMEMLNRIIRPPNLSKTEWEVMWILKKMGNKAYLRDIIPSVNGLWGDGCSPNYVAKVIPLLEYKNLIVNTKRGRLAEISVTLEGAEVFG